MKIFIGADYKGVERKNLIKERLLQDGYEVIDTTIQDVDKYDFPDFAFEVGNNVVKNEGSIGILICNTGIGMSIAANKVKGVRCARILSEEDAYTCKNHNGVNVIALDAHTDLEYTMKMIDIFIKTAPVDVERRLKRLDKIINYENGEYNEL